MADFSGAQAVALVFARSATGARRAQTDEGGQTQSQRAGFGDQQIRRVDSGEEDDRRKVDGIAVVAPGQETQ